VRIVGSVRVYVVTELKESGNGVMVPASKFTDSYNPDKGGATFLRNVGSYKSHKA
jgi:hypothetical protein